MPRRETYRKIGKSHSRSFPPWIGSPLFPPPPPPHGPLQPRPPPPPPISEQEEEEEGEEEEEEGEGGHILPPPNPISTFGFCKKKVFRSLALSPSLDHSFFFLSCRFVSKSAVRRREGGGGGRRREERDGPTTPALLPRPQSDAQVPSKKEVWKIPIKCRRVNSN